MNFESTSTAFNVIRVLTSSSVDAKDCDSVFQTEDRHTTVLPSAKPPAITSFLSGRDCRACDSHALSVLY